MAQYEVRDLLKIPQGLPVPVDDGAANHLTQVHIPSIPLPSTQGSSVDLSAVTNTAVVFTYPRTGQPGHAPLAPDWDMIPG